MSPNEVAAVATKQLDQTVDGADDHVYSLFEELQDPAIYSALSGGMQEAALGIVKATLENRIDAQPPEETEIDQE